MGVVDYIKKAKDYYDEYKGLIDAAGSAGKAYLDYKDQKRRNELDEQAYRDYMLEQESAGREAQSAVDINLTPMTVTGVPTSKADVTSFQKVAQGGIIGLKNGGDPNAGITALRKKAPGVVKAMGFNKGGGPGIEALRKKAPDVVKRMGFNMGSDPYEYNEDDPYEGKTSKWLKNIKSIELIETPAKEDNYKINDKSCIAKRSEKNTIGHNVFKSSCMPEFFPRIVKYFK